MSRSEATGGCRSFFSDDDRRAYLALIAEACAAHGTICLGWCLMDNHVHLILVPTREDGLRATLGEAHRRYSRRINFREGWRGFLFQGRFASYPMDGAHLMAAVRYVENNPVAAKIVARAEDWRWSSAASHVAGKRTGEDPLTDVAALGQHVRNWRMIRRMSRRSKRACAPAGHSLRPNGLQKPRRRWRVNLARSDGGRSQRPRHVCGLISIVSPKAGVVSPKAGVPNCDFVALWLRVIYFSHKATKLRSSKEICPKMR
jgi:REP element-mobilizing transposase RayT